MASATLPFWLARNAVTDSSHLRSFPSVTPTCTEQQTLQAYAVTVLASQCAQLSQTDAPPPLDMHMNGEYTTCVQAVLLALFSQAA